MSTKTLCPTCQRWVLGEDEERQSFVRFVPRPYSLAQLTAGDRTSAPVEREQKAA
jgi:hypothetical protein